MEGYRRLIQIDDLRSDPVFKFCPPARDEVTAEPNDVIIAWDGANAGTSSFGLSGVIGSTLAILRPKHKNIFTAYLGHFVRVKQQCLRERCKGATVPHIDGRVLEELDIPLPPLPLQKRIAEVLDKADELRAKHRTALDKLDTLTQSIFLEMFGDPVTNPKEVKVVRLSEITTRITDGIHQKPNYTETGVPFISVKDITTGILKFGDCKFISLEDHQKFTKRCKAERSDILYTKVGATYGRPALVDTDREFSLYVSVCLIKPQKNLVDPFFLNAALGTAAIKNQADQRIKGIGVPDLHLDQIQNFLIPLPSIDEQRDFSRRIAAVEKLKASHRASLGKLNGLFVSLQDRAFKGELW